MPVAMLEKIKTYHRHPLVQEFRDVRILGLVVFCIIVLLVSWSGVRVIETNYALEQQIARIEEQNKLRKLENANQKLSNQYYQTDQYLELQARKQFGKAAPGEMLLLVPKNVAMVHTVELPKPAEEDGQAMQTHKSFYQQNFEAWMRFFFHRRS